MEGGASPKEGGGEERAQRSYQLSAETWGAGVSWGGARSWGGRGRSGAGVFEEVQGSWAQRAGGKLSTSRPTGQSLCAFLGMLMSLGSYAGSEVTGFFVKNK